MSFSYPLTPTIFSTWKCQSRSYLLQCSNKHDLPIPFQLFLSVKVSNYLLRSHCPCPLTEMLYFHDLGETMNVSLFQQVLSYWFIFHNESPKMFLRYWSLRKIVVLPYEEIIQRFSLKPYCQFKWRIHVSPFLKPIAIHFNIFIPIQSIPTISNDSNFEKLDCLVYPWMNDTFVQILSQWHLTVYCHEYLSLFHDKMPLISLTQSDSEHLLIWQYQSNQPCLPFNASIHQPCWPFITLIEVLQWLLHQ